MRSDIEQVVRFGDVFQAVQAFDQLPVMFIAWGLDDRKGVIGGRTWRGFSMERSEVGLFRGLLTAFGNGPHEGEPFWIQVEPK